MKKISVFVNGFGRIGRLATRIMLEDDNFEIVGINDLCSYEQIVYLLKHDSIYGKLEYSLELKDDILYIDNGVKQKKIKLFSEESLEKLGESLKSLNTKIDVFLQSSGMFLSKSSNEVLLKYGVERVVVSAPPSDDMPVFIYGVNNNEYKQERIFSASSCSATAIVPIFKIVDKYFGIDAAMMSMYHSYTSYQHLLDGNHYSKDIRRTRSATLNTIPLESSAAKATSYFFPELENRLSAKSIRLPIPSMTLYDLSIKLKNLTNLNKINEILKKEINSEYCAILGYTEELDSSDRYLKNPLSATINIPLNTLSGGTLLRLSAWQDNEYGYTRSLIKLIDSII